MSDKVHRIHSLSEEAPWDGGLPPVGSDEHPHTIRALDRVLAIQRPAVLAHLRSIRLRHPDAPPDHIIRMLERRYLAAVTTGGAAVGATAVIPGIGTGVTLALSGVETVGFLEATALFAQSVAEVHGIPVSDPDRARALVLTLMLGQEGVDLVAQLANQAAGKGPARDRYWGQMITQTLPRAAVGPLVDRLKSTFVRQFAARGGASWIGKALPFGIGAAVGSQALRTVAPFTLPPQLEPLPGATRLEYQAGRRIRRVSDAITGGTARGASAVRGALTRGKGSRELDSGEEDTAEPV